MPTSNNTFSVKNGLSVANTIIVDSTRNLSNIASINANTVYSRSGVNVIAQAADAYAKANAVYLQKNYNFVGNLTNGTGTARFYAPSNITLRSAYFTVGNPPTGSNSTISIIKNNTTTLNTINITAGSYISTNTPMSASMTTSDFLTVTTAASSNAANGSLTIIYTYD